MSIRIEKPGMLATIQDLGRYGFQKLGINPTGAMDKSSVRIANILLGNNENAAAIEMNFPAPEFVFERDMLFAIGGAEFAAEIDGVPVKNWQVQIATSGSKLVFKNKIAGNRGYLCIQGGFRIDQWLGSSSTNLVAEAGGFRGRALQKDDTIEITEAKVFAKNVRDFHNLGESMKTRYKNSVTIRATKCAEFDMLTALSEQRLFSQTFSITPESNRMGFRLDGDPLHLIHNIELLSSAVTFGTLQLLPNGQLIALMADHQTTGGYPKLANIVSVDLPKFAQLGAGDSVRFELVSNKVAESYFSRYERELAYLKMGIKFTEQ